MRRPLRCFFFLSLILIQQASAQKTFWPNELDIPKKLQLLWAADWTADGQRIAVGGDDSLLIIYEVQRMIPVSSFRMNGMIRQLSWHPDGKTLAIATSSSVWLLAADKFTQLEGINDGARGIGWSSNGTLLATADNNGLVKIWNAEGRLLRTIRKEDSNSYFALDWHPAKDVIVATGDDIRIMDTAGHTLKVIKHRKESTGILTVNWHPSGEFFATGDYGQDKEGVPSIIQFWKEDGTLIKTLHGSKAEYRNIRWNKDGDRLATASDALRIWNKAGELLHTGAATGLLWGIDWNEKSDSIITTGIDGKIRLWSMEAKLIRSIR
jgi:WD40 repeat protein